MIIITDLQSLILDVRSGISDLPEDFASDVQIYKDLKEADAFVTAVARSDVDSNLKMLSIVRLCRYYTYLNYTSLAEATLGTMPTTAPIKLEAYRQGALSFLRLITAYPLTDDLQVDETRISGRITVNMLSTSILDDEYYD